MDVNKEWVVYRDNKEIAKSQQAKWIPTPQQPLGSNPQGIVNPDTPNCSVQFYFQTNDVATAPLTNYGTFFYTYYCTFRAQKGFRYLRL